MSPVSIHKLSKIHVLSFIYGLVIYLPFKIWELVIYRL